MMELSDENVSFGDFSELDDVTFEKINKILHGTELPSTEVEFPFTHDEYQDDNVPGEVEQEYCPVETATQLLPGAPIFVPQYQMSGGVYVGGVPTVVAPYAVPPMVNGVPIVPPPAYPNVTTMYPHPNNASTMCNGPSIGGYNHPHTVMAPPPMQMVGPGQGMAVCPTSMEMPMTSLPLVDANGHIILHTSQGHVPLEVISCPPDVGQLEGAVVLEARPDFDFVYYDPCVDVPVSTSIEIIQECHKQDISFIQSVDAGQEVVYISPADQPVDSVQEMSYMLPVGQMQEVTDPSISFMSPEGDCQEAAGQSFSFMSPVNESLDFATNRDSVATTDVTDGHADVISDPEVTDSDTHVVSCNDNESCGNVSSNAVVDSLGNGVGNLSIQENNTPVLDSSPVNECKPKENASPPPSPPKAKSWAGLFSSRNAIVTYTSDKPEEPSRKSLVSVEAPSVQIPTKMPVSVEEDLAAFKLGGMLRSLKMYHGSVVLQPRGLVNKGNWCYINATLQALVACPPFYHLIKCLSEFAPLSRSLGSSSTPILDSLIAFIKNFSPWVRPIAKGSKKGPELITGSPFEPINVYKMLQVIEANPSFKLGKQEDAEEFLNCILDGLHEEMAASIGLYIGDEPDGSDKQKNGVSENEDNENDEEDSWQQVGPKKKSVQTRRTVFAKTPTADIFAGHIRSAVFRASAKESATLEPFFTLKLDIQDDKIWTVRDALNGLVSLENVQGYQCSKTKEDVEIVRKVSLEELPPVLILHLKCFVFNKTGGCQKLLKKIDFDVDLNITKDLLSSTARSKIPQSHRSYKLFAVVFHHGKNATGGHYTTDVFHAGINSWIHIDDARVQTVPVSSVVKYLAPRMPYLLYYRRTDIS